MEQAESVPMAAGTTQARREEACKEEGRQQDDSGEEALPAEDRAPPA